MKNIFKMMAMALVVAGSTVMMGVSPVSAGSYICPNGHTESGTTYTEACKGDNGYGNDTTSGTKSSDLMTVLNTVINVVLGVIGFIAVAMIIMGGISFTTSQGDTAKTTKARNTILYGVVGLVVALLAFAIVNFVLGNVFTTS